MPCKTCEVSFDEVRYLREEIKILRAERNDLQAKLFGLLRLPTTLQALKVESSEPQRIQGVQSPMRQRIQAEAESKKKYWEEKLKKSEELPEAVTS